MPIRPDFRDTIRENPAMTLTVVNTVLVIVAFILFYLKVPAISLNGSDFNNWTTPILTAVGYISITTLYNYQGDKMICCSRKC